MQTESQSQSLSTQDLKALLQKVIRHTVEESAPVIEEKVTELMPTEVLPEEPVLEEILLETASKELPVEAVAEVVEVAAIPAEIKTSSRMEQDIILDSSEIAVEAVQPEKKPKKAPSIKKSKSADAEVQTVFVEDKSKIQELENALERANLEIHKLKLTLQDTEGTLTLKMHASTLDNQEAKARLLRLVEDKKELEDKLTLLSGEKATLAARLQSFMQKCSKHEETEFLLTDQIKELTATLEATTEELTHTKALEAQNRELQEALKDKIDVVEELELANRTLQAQYEGLNQELAVTKACLHEQSAIFEEEQQKHRLLAQEHVFVQKRSEEQENHLRLLEQHLARRVKECALVSKQLDDVMDRTSQLQSSLTASSQRCQTLEEALDAAKKLEHALRIEFDSQSNILQDALHQKDRELFECNQILEQKEKELEELKKLEQRFAELEELARRSMQIISTPSEIQQRKPFFSFES